MDNTAALSMECSAMATLLSVLLSAGGNYGGTGDDNS
jgi:hypothetical protein